MSYSVYLDDVRGKPDGWDEIARTHDEFFELVEARGAPSRVSFDHDLGGFQPTGYDVADKLIGMDLDADCRFLPDDFAFEVHSMNPVGAENIRELLGGYLQFRKEEG